MATRKLKRVEEPPQGLVYVPDFISLDEETDLLNIMRELEFKDFVLQGQAAKRKVYYYGYRYEFHTQHVQPSEEFPDWLKSIRDRAAPFAGLKPEQIEQALIGFYAPGAGIGWHRDAPAFGPTVIGISLASDDVMRFRKTLHNSLEHFKQPLARRSLYVLSGPARALWQHSVAPVKDTRYSITLRTVKDRFKTA